MSNHYKFIFLIIDSDDLPCYQGLRNIIKLYHNSYDEIKSLFLRADESITECKIIDDILYVPGKESFIPGILNKTLKGMDYCYKNFRFDYLVRSNLSSFWDFNRLLKLKFPESNLVFAIIGNSYNVQFPSGAGFILSKDIVELCIKNVNNFIEANNLQDDVVFGLFFKRHGLQITLGKRYDCTIKSEKYNKDELDNILRLEPYHYRIKGEGDRKKDLILFKQLYDYIYLK